MTKSYASAWDAIEKTPDDAAQMQVRGALMVDLQKRMRATGDTQAALAKRLDVTQPRISDVIRGRIDVVSVDILIDLLAKLGVKVQVRMRASRMLRQSDSRKEPAMVGKRTKATAQASEALEDARDLAIARARLAKPVGKPVPLHDVAARLGIKLGNAGRRDRKAR